MPDLGNLLNPISLPLIPIPNPKSVTDKCESSSSPNSDLLKTLEINQNRPSDWEAPLRFPILRESEVCQMNETRVLKRCRLKMTARNKSMDEYEKDSVHEKVELGDSVQKSSVPFLGGAKKLDKCRMCQDLINPGTDVSCSVRGCQAGYHLECVKQRQGVSAKQKFKCPQHACYLCKQKFQLWRCVRCEVACHLKCAPFPEHVKHLSDQPGQAICWKHHDDWRQEKKEQLAAPAKTMEEVFDRLPLPSNPEEFDIDKTWKDTIETESEPPPYLHIRRNIYLVKIKREDADVGCTSCISSGCSENCVCRVQCISCSKACRCSDTCTNRPFRKEKKVKVVKTEVCGWGVEAAESINKGEFIIEYVGEVINDVMCERRLWDMRYMGNQNFYMCEVRKDFTIDATFKGNSSRFLNHSCDPNCNLEKWQLDGETRIGVFAARSIQAGEPLTYDYRFKQFGPEVKCKCGAQNCQGYLGAKRKISKVEALCNWGAKGRRSATDLVSIVRL